MRRKTAAIIGFVFCAAVALTGCGHMAGGGAVTSGGTQGYSNALHSKLEGDERAKVAAQIIKVDDKVKKTYYPDPDTVFVAPTGSLKTVGLLMFDANIMRGGGKTPGCCANLFPLQGVQQIISERMLESWEKALNKYVTSDLTLVPLEKITQSASYQKEGKPVKDYPNDTDTSIFQKMDSLLGFKNVKYSFVAVPGGSKAPNTDLAVPRGLRKFSWIGGEGAAAFKLGHGAPIREIGAEMGLDAAILVNSSFTWETDRAQSISTNLRGSAKMTISATLNVPNGRWEEAVKAINQKTYGVAMSPAFRVYSVSLEDKVTVPYDPGAQWKFASCCRDGIGDEAERDLFAPMLAEYDQAVDMLVERMVADLRSTHK